MRCMMALLMTFFMLLSEGCCFCSAAQSSSGAIRLSTHTTCPSQAFNALGVFVDFGELTASKFHATQNL